MVRSLIDGEASDCLPGNDRGLQYGDGLFETIAVTEGRLEFWRRHLVRLEEGCRRLQIPLPDRDTLLREAARLFTADETGILKIVVTRGSGGRGYRQPEPQRPRRILSAHPWPDYPEALWRDGIRARICQTRLGINPQLAGIKHLNRLEQVLARSEWDDPQIHEGIMCDAGGALVEGVMSNLFLVQGGAITTPDLSNCGVAGIIRQVVLEIAQAFDIEVNIGAVSIADLGRAKELFVTNSVVGLWPIRALGEHRFEVGEITRKIQAELKTRRREESQSIR